MKQVISFEKMLSWRVFFKIMFLNGHELSITFGYESKAQDSILIAHEHCNCFFDFWKCEVVKSPIYYKDDLTTKWIEHKGMDKGDCTQSCSTKNCKSSH